MVYPWWQIGTFYQIYPRSFQDSDGDGIGDLEGIRRRLDYLAWLGVDAIWLSPIFPSPMHDFGYDVADYCGIDPLFGTLASFDALVADAHARGLRIILDFVPNHTSSSHPWFVASRRSRSDYKRGWYIWRDPAPDGGPPNNWLGHFGGSAWTFDAITGQYYYHAYLAEQPDLDWRNPDVREAMHEVLRFWLGRGVDGIRVDVMWHLIKDAALRDDPPNPKWRPGDPEIDRLLHLHSADQPEVHGVVAEMRRVLDEFGDRVLIGEIYLPIDRLVAYYGEHLGGAHLPFNFQLLEASWSAKLAEIIAAYETALPEGGWPNWVASNHDRPRIAARVGPEQARVAAMLLLTLRGTPTLYYGDELGIGHVEIAADLVRDPWARTEPKRGRDPSRTPMQWDESRFAGFSSHPPWLPLTPDHESRNVDAMRRDPGSILSLVRALLHYRRTRPSLLHGTWRLLDASADVLAYERRDPAELTVVALNLGDSGVNWTLPADMSGGRVMLSSYCDREAEPVGSVLSLRPNEGVIIETT